MSGPYDSQYAYHQGYPQYQTAYTGYEQYNTYPQQGFAPYQQHPEQPRYYGQNFDPSYQTQPQYGQPPQEGERGMLGALGGGAAGGIAGHKMGHGILGTIGGAIVGSLTEDFAKKKHKNKKHHHGRKDAHLSSGSSHVASGGLGSGLASSFFNQKR